MVGVVENVVGVVEKVVGGWRCGWSKITIEKEKRLPQRSHPVTRIIPFKHRWGNLSEHRLIDITDLRTYMVLCEFPQP